jgi:hypothetical protein
MFESTVCLCHPITTARVVLSQAVRRNGALIGRSNANGRGIRHFALCTWEIRGRLLIPMNDASNLANKLYNSSQATNARDQMGVGNKFIAPLIANGKVYVATLNGVEVLARCRPPTGILRH